MTRVPALLLAQRRSRIDRILVAQAQLEGLPILTADPVFAAYAVETIPAT